MIAVENVSKSIAGRQIVKDVSFTVPDGSITGFIGPNGAGKTTLMRVALGLTEAEHGCVRFNEREYRQLPVPLHEVGSLIDARWLMPNLRTRDILTYCARTQGVSVRSEALLSLVGLDQASDRRVAHLSLGMRQRLGIAVALIASPRHLILDEPLNGLDPTGIGWLRELLRRLRSEGISILLSSHIVSELALIADDIVLINNGMVVLSGSLAQLAAQGEPRVLARTDQPNELASAIRNAHGQVELKAEEPVVITGLTSRDVFKIAAAERVILDELTTQHRTLDDIYQDAISSQSEPWENV